MNLPDPNTEPVRRNLYVAAAVVAVATVLGVLGFAEAWTPQVVAGALGLGLTEFAAIAYGVERARDKAYAPATVHEAFDAEAVLKAAEDG
jgi:predicted anti-sigma-YlaC factor YlaD